ncbi:MAG: hypothetical protein RLZZ316_702 [Bacteroidota bacterium]
MKQHIHKFLFGSSIGPNKWLNLTWLLFRLHTGISMAIHAGWPKASEGLAPAWFVKQVADLGFNFPAPAFWATVASWGELVGGLLIAIGLFTRFAALQLAFQFFVISFLWYENPEPLSGMYIQQLYFWCYVLITVAGGGACSADALITKRLTIKPASLIKPALAVLILLLGTSTSGLAQQRKPLKGSGKLVNKVFNDTGFDKINLYDLDGEVVITVGKPFAVAISIDDNLEPLLETTVTAGTLQLQLKNNESNRMYIEDTHIKINISLPEISVLQHSGNSSLQVTGVVGRYLRLNHAGNGDAALTGTIDELEIIKSGNGDVNAGALIAKKVTINKSGNGNCTFFTNQTFIANGSGNGDIINKGTGIANAKSTLSGNGEILVSGQPPVKARNKKNDW